MKIVYYITQTIKIGILIIGHTVQIFTGDIPIIYDYPEHPFFPFLPFFEKSENPYLTCNKSFPQKNQFNDDPQIPFINNPNTLKCNYNINNTKILNIPKQNTKNKKRRKRIHLNKNMHPLAEWLNIKNENIYIKNIAKKLRYIIKKSNVFSKIKVSKINKNYSGHSNYIRKVCAACTPGTSNKSLGIQYGIILNHFKDYFGTCPTNTKRKRTNDETNIRKKQKTY